MTQCMIRIQAEDPEKPDRFVVLYNGILSHRVSKDRLDEIVTSAPTDFFTDDIRIREHGAALFHLLDGTGGRLRAEMDNADDLSLCLDLPPFLDVLPFEVMFHDGFVTVDHEANIFRMVGGKGDKGKTPEKRPLKVLFMACAPESGTPLDFEKEEELILGETEKLHLNLEVEDSGSLEGLGDMVRGLGGFDVVHLSGHAGIDDDVGPVFYMEDELGRVDKVGPKRLRNALKAFLPRILFLSGCSTSMREPTSKTPSFTEQMANAKIPFVMGWSQPVTDVGATFLAARLFTYLSMGKGIGEAVCLARREVRNVHGAWALFRVYTTGAQSEKLPCGPLIQPGQGIRPGTMRKTVYRTLENSQVRVLEQGFVGRRRQIQRGVKALRGFEDRRGLLITGAAGVGKSCLAGKFIERFKNKKLVVVHGELETGDLFNKLIGLFERYGVRSGLEAIHSETPPEERIMALFRQAFQELPSIIYLDDFEQNLERATAGQSDAEDRFVVKSKILPLVRGLLCALPWAEGKTTLIISSRYPFVLEHRGTDLPLAHLVPVPLMSMREADLKKKIEKLDHIANSDHKELYVAAGMGNPRLLEWLDKIAAEEEKYDLTDLRNRIRGKQADYVAAYLFEIMADTGGEGFASFLRRSAVFRQPAPEEAFVLFGTTDQIRRAAWLTLLEQETRPDADIFWVHPMIRETEWQKLPASEQKTAHEQAADWHCTALENTDEKPFDWLSEAVWHCLASGRVRQACEHAIPLGQVMEDMQLYRERVAMEQEVADHVTEKIIAEAIREKDGNVAVLLSDLGTAFHMLGDYPKVIKWTEKALEMAERLFGEDHQHVAICNNNLGVVYKSLGEHGKAIDYYQRALAIDRKNFGENHPTTARNYNNLGAAYWALGEYGKAVDYFEWALAVGRKNFGENHPQVAVYNNNLGAAYKALGEYGKAVDYFKRALAIDRKNFGENHPDTAIDYNNLGGVYYSLGVYGKAVDYHERSLAILSLFFDEDHPSMQRIKGNLETAKSEL